jgi:hypothetical protein
MTLADLLAGAYSQLNQQQVPSDFAARLGQMRPGQLNADPRMFQGPPVNWPFGLPTLQVPQGNLNQAPGYPVLGTLPT